MQLEYWFIYIIIWYLFQTCLDTVLSSLLRVTLCWAEGLQRFLPTSASLWTCEITWKLRKVLQSEWIALFEWIQSVWEERLKGGFVSVGKYLYGKETTGTKRALQEEKKNINIRNGSKIIQVTKQKISYSVMADKPALDIFFTVLPGSLV